MHFTLVAALVLSAASAASATIRGMHYKSDPVNVKSSADRLGIRDLERRATAKLVYYGGPVIGSVVINPVFYGAVADADRLVEFYKGVPNSSYFDKLSEYSTSSTRIRRGRLGVAWTDPNPTTETFDLNDDGIKTYFTWLIQSGVISPTANSYYPMHFGPQYTISREGTKSCVDFCAYHGTLDISNLNVGVQYLYYGVIPDQYTTGCAGGCGSNPTPFNNLCSVASHELTEMVTDPGVGLVTVYAPPLAWYDTTNGEIADICNGMQASTFGGNGITYTVQQFWSNARHSCVA
ncbi:hypothetical protein HK101_003449 [Irineochytrium annulatum]|nr:hypothetical protein HK101_003449 [Irineochytrium annulatum]